MKMNMRKTTYATGSAAAMTAVTFSLGGCAAGTQFSDTLGVQNVDSTGNKITATGREEVKIVPGMVEIEYSIYSSKDTAATCQEQNNKDLSAAIEALKSLGVEEESIQTFSYGLNPIYDRSSSNKEVTGYEMTTRLTVSNIPIDKAGAAISESMAAGVNGIDSVSYSSSNYDASYQEALKGAMAVAKAKADMLAGTNGKSIVDVTHAKEFGYNPYVRNSSFSGAGAIRTEAMITAADTVVMPGKVSVEAQVTANYEIQ